MSDNKDNHEDDWGDDDKTRIQLPKKTSKDLHSNGDLIGSGEDATAYKKPHASQAGTHDRESAKTERAQTPQEKKTPKTRIKQKLTGKDATKAAASRQKAPKNTPRA